ncbi:MAG: hypothetical protein E6Q36_05390 [Chryseobacterium sp.]|nr:MAG: hypothetical protein E6Q36_05390 [Chryseobacterium sp.]
MKKYQILESIATMSWLLMDFCWMSKWLFLATILSNFTLFFSIFAMSFYNGNKKSEETLLWASLSWVLMNTLWMYSEIQGFEYLIGIAKICFVSTIIFIGIAIYFFYYEKENTEFKRLKIK